MWKGDADSLVFDNGQAFTPRQKKGLHVEAFRLGDAILRALMPKVLRLGLLQHARHRKAQVSAVFRVERDASDQATFQALVR